MTTELINNTNNIVSKEVNIIKFSGQGIALREENGEFYSEGYIATTHVDRAREDGAEGTALTREALQQIVDFINNQVATTGGIGSTRTVSYRHDWVREQDPTLTPAGMAVPPAELRQLEDGHFGVWVKTHHNKNHAEFDKIKYDVEHGYLPGYSIEFREGNSLMTKIGSKAVKIIQSIKDFVGYAFADARMIANPKAIIESFGYREIEGEILMKEKKKKAEVSEETPEGAEDKLHEATETPSVELGEKADVVDDESEEDEDESDAQEKKENEAEAVALATGKQPVQHSGKPIESVQTTKTPYSKKEVETTEKTVDVTTIVNTAMKEVKKEVEAIKLSTRVLNTAIGEQHMEDVKVRQMSEALAKNDVVSFRQAAIDYIDENHMVEKALADPTNYTTGFKSNLKVRSIGKGLKIMGDIAVRGTLDSGTNTSSYTQSPVEFADLFAPGLIQTFNTQHNLFGFLKKIQHPGGIYFQWKMITNMDPLSNATMVSRDDVSVLKNYSNKLNYQTPLKIARRGISVTDFIQRYSAQSLGDLFQAEVQIQMDQMMIDVETDLFGEVADGTNFKSLGLEAVADHTGNTTLYGYTRSTANRLAGDALADQYVEVNGAITENNIRNGIQKMLIQGVVPGNLAIVTSPKGKQYLFNLLDNNRRFNTTLAEFGFDQKTVASYDGIPVIESWKCNSTLATSSSSSACMYLIDTSEDLIVIAMEPKLVGLAKVGPATEAYLEMDYAHVYRQPRKIHLINNFATG